MSRPLVLVPSSKAKADGGGGPAFADSAALRDGPLAPARGEVLGALRRAATELDDHGIARLCGVAAADVAPQRQALADLDRAPTLPAHRRYTGVVHRFAALDELDPGAVGVDVGVLSGLLGVAWLGEPVPHYRLEVTGRVPDLGVLGTWWRARLGPPLRELAVGRRVWDLLPKEFARLWPAAERDGVEAVAVTFVRDDGRAAPAASAKVGKGHLLRLLVEDPSLTPEGLVDRQPLDGWRIEHRGHGLAAVVAG